MLHDRVRGDLVVYKALHHSALQQMLFHDLLNVLLFHAGIEGAVGINDHYGAELAQTEAAGPDDFYLFLQTVCGKLLLKLGDQLCAARRSTAGAAADKYLRTNHKYTSKSLKCS